MWMTAFEIYFMATLCPVMVCVATSEMKKRKERGHQPGTKGDGHQSYQEGERTLHFPKGAFGDVPNDGVLPEL